MKLPDPIRRALRTFFQAFTAAIAFSGVLSAIATSGVVDWAVLKKVGISAAFSGLVALVSFIQNALEDKTGRSFLVAKATPDPEPTTPAPGHDEPLIEASEEPAPKPAPVVKKAAASKTAKKATKKKPPVITSGGSNG